MRINIYNTNTKQKVWSKYMYLVDAYIGKYKTDSNMCFSVVCSETEQVRLD